MFFLKLFRLTCRGRPLFSAWTGTFFRPGTGSAWTGALLGPGTGSTWTGVFLRLSTGEPPEAATESRP